MGVAKFQGIKGDAEARDLPPSGKRPRSVAFHYEGTRPHMQYKIKGIRGQGHNQALVLRSSAPIF